MMRHTATNVLVFIALSVVLVAGPATEAATYDWNVADGEFTNAASWTAGGPPAAADTARFNQAATNNVTLAQSLTNTAVIFSQGIARFDLRGNSYTLSAASSALTTPAGACLISNGTVDVKSMPITAAGDAVTVADAGRLIFNNPGGDAVDLNAGTLNVTRGGQMVQLGGSRTILGHWGLGTVNVTGAGSIFSNTYVVMGFAGPGVLNVLDGAQVVNSGPYLLVSASGSKITVGGANSLLRITSASQFQLGAYNGYGDMIINSNGTVATEGLLLAGNKAGVRVNIVVDNATMTNADANFYGEWFASSIGHTGIGTLTITNNGRVYGNRTLIGGYANGIGTATVVGPGSVMTNSRINVGWASGANGTLIITNGGRVYSAGADGVGTYAGAVGRVEVVGSGSRWDGGNNSGGYVGLSDAGGSGSMLVGAGATVASAGQFFIGAGGTLELAGGTVQSGATPWFRFNAASSVFKGSGTVVGACTNSGIFLPGGTNATGTLSFSNDFALLSTSTSTFDFVSGACDQAIVQGAFTAGGELNLSFSRPITDGRYVIFDVAGTHSGAFSKTNWVGLPLGGKSTAGFDGNDYVVNVLTASGTTFGIR